jgi:hypothetical protein
VHHH